MAHSTDGYDIARKNARELGASVADYEAAARLKNAEKRLSTARERMLTWMRDNDVVNNHNYGWEDRMASFVAAIARPDAAGTVAAPDAEDAS